MSYLHRPRLHFAGRFEATVSTVNNTPCNFKEVKPKSPAGWNPDGNGAWRLLGCRVTSAWQASGPAAASDPILSAIVADSDRGAPAKIVDLDPQQQLVSAIFGLEVRIADANGQNLLRGRFAPARFNDFWSRDCRAKPDEHNDLYGAAMWQSELQDVEWLASGNSPFLAELKAATRAGRLSIKFNVDCYSMDVSDGLFCTGRIVGTIGPVRDGELARQVLGRQLVVEHPHALNSCVALLEGGRILLDLGNTLRNEAGVMCDVGELTLGYLPGGADADEPRVVTGPIPYLSAGWYERTAGIVELSPLEAAEDLEERRLVLIASSPRELLREVPEGLHVAVDESVFRMSPGDTVDIAFHATRFGRPHAAALVRCWIESKYLSPNGPPTATPLEGLGGLPKRLNCDENGVGILRVSAGVLAHPRGFIDGQVYGVVFKPKGTGYPPVSRAYLFFLVFDAFKPDVPLCWYGSERGSIAPIFEKYASLYPVMRRFLDLASYDDVCNHLEMLEHAFSLPLDDPNSMPVTRDLSPAKRTAVLSWLREREPGEEKPRLGAIDPNRRQRHGPVNLQRGREARDFGSKTRAFANALSRKETPEPEWE